MILYRLLWPLARAFYWLAFRPQVEGTEHLPRTGGYVISMNHVSGFDPPLVSVLVPRPVVHLTKAELFRYPILGYLLRTLGCIPVRRGEVDPTAMRAAIAALKAGYPMSVFPEGTRHAQRRGQPRGGAAFLALHAQVPIVPGAIVGPYRWGRPLKVRFGPPLRFDDGVPGRGTHQKIDSMSRRVMEAILALGAEGGPVNNGTPSPGIDSRTT
jgi:1-acyl-sn-glycerol-3-phosphate acyltransferase